MDGARGAGSGGTILGILVVSDCSLAFPKFPKGLNLQLAKVLIRELLPPTLQQASIKQHEASATSLHLQNAIWCRQRMEAARRHLRS